MSTTDLDGLADATYLPSPVVIAGRTYTIGKAKLKLGDGYKVGFLSPKGAHVEVIFDRASRRSTAGSDSDLTLIERILVGRTTVLDAFPGHITDLRGIPDPKLRAIIAQASQDLAAEEKRLDASGRQARETARVKARNAEAAKRARAIGRL
jgi:hypothetical protein